MNIFILLVVVTIKTLTVTSTAFHDKGFIPVKYTCEGENINPPIKIKKIPKATKSLVLIMDDPDAPLRIFDHWVMWNIPPQEFIKENSAPGLEGKNGAGENKYVGPCPPEGTHRYFFKVYALDARLELKTDADKKSVIEAMKGHIIAKGELEGLYKRVKGEEKTSLKDNK